MSARGAPGVMSESLKPRFSRAHYTRREAGASGPAADARLDDARSLFDETQSKTQDSGPAAPTVFHIRRQPDSSLGLRTPDSGPWTRDSES